MPLLRKTMSVIGRCIFDTACNRHSNETVTLRKHVTKYKNMREWMIEFLRKFVNRDIKIARVNTILLTESINFNFNFVLCCDPL